MKSMSDPSRLSEAVRYARKAVVFVIGTTVLVFGLALTVMPGPAMVVIPLGLAILASEFVWARRLLRKVKDGTLDLKDRVKSRVLRQRE